jgi:hypothetical protein
MHWSSSMRHWGITAKWRGVVELVAAMQSSVCALLLMDLALSGKLDKAPKESFWRSIDGPDSLREELWLLCYEAGIRGWGGFSDAHVLADSHFAALHARGVHFYEPGAKTKLLFNLKSGTLEKFKITDLDDFFERDDAADYLEYEAGDGGYEGVIFDDDDEDDEVEDETDEQDDADDEDSEEFYF